MTEGGSKTQELARPDYLQHRKRLRERFQKAGLDGFAEYEIVEVILTLAIPRKDVKPIAKTLLKKFGSVRKILDATPKELMQVDGIGKVAPITIRIVREIANLYLQQSSEKQDFMSDPESLVRFWRAKIGTLPNEVFQVAYLDSAHRLVRDGVETLEEGTVNRASIYPRRVIEAALRNGASALVLAHNHPNGNPQPSEADKTITRAIVLAATTVGVKILDHLIVTVDDVFSFRREGLL